VITPRRTRLVRVRDLRAFREAIVEAVLQADPSRLVVVPNDAAAEQLQRVIGRRAEVWDAAALVTRDGLYERLHARVKDPPRRLSKYERDALARAAAREASALVLDPRPAGEPGDSGGVRPGFIAALVRFYDQLRRQGQQVARFEELLEDTLERDAEFDRGADRMLRQTRLLAAAFRSYERRIEASGACDEHTLRQHLAADSSPSPIRAVIVTVADWIADPGGLYQADFDLLTRLPGLETLDLVATEGTLGSGFHQRIHDWLPGLEERDFAAPVVSRPRLATPAGAPDRLWFTARDREEELIGVARRLGAADVDRTAVVYKRPLPYLYLAREVLGRAGIPYRTSDAWPLAAEPFAAALDLVFEAVASSFTRDALVALLRSPHFVWDAGASLPREAVSALDRALSDARYLGDPDRLLRLAIDWESSGAAPAARPAVSAAIVAAASLSSLAAPAPTSAQIERVLSFLAAHDAGLEPFATNGAPADPGDIAAERRARAAIVDTLEGLASASRAHDDPPVDINGLASLVRRALEEQTFRSTTDSGGGGLHLLDDQAARYGDFDAITFVGLIDGEWPERPDRNIFYSPSLLRALGWPSEKDWRAAAEARFLDLLVSPAEGVTLSTITLDDEALVEASAFLDELPRVGLSTVAIAPPPAGRRFLDEALSLDPPVLVALDDEARSWAEMRIARSGTDDPAFHGQVGVQASRTWSVSALETYLDCPFKFFGQRVLKLEEEPDDEEVMDPKQQGQFVHEVFETFFHRWQTGGRQAVTPANLDEARGVFGEVVEECLGGLSETEAALERTRLLGSSAAAGLGEAVLRMEAERPVGVIGRLLEHRLEGEFTMQTRDGPRVVRLNGKADRVDLLEDGTFRLIDYKLGWPPNRARALQLPIYSLCAEQQLAGRQGKTWTLAEAAYLAFKGPKRVVPLFSSGDRDRVLRESQQRLVDAIDAIARGEFPPHPHDVYRCDTCTYSAVCRKDYVGDV
jgi:ATP-dependent helicase/nuclease subunit B